MVAIVTTKNYYCFACGSSGSKWLGQKIINDSLAREWKLTPGLRAAFDARESSFCPECGNSQRTRDLAEAIVTEFDFGTKNLKEWVEAANKRKIKVAEINSCGALHQIFQELRHLSYSEFVPENDIKQRLKNFLKDIRREDLYELSYKDNSFDLVLTSDVLEHVPDYKQAVAECIRVLKPGGLLLFTIPLIWGRKTINRKDLASSYHGSGEPDNLVYWEFGSDVVAGNGLKIMLKRPGKVDYVLGFRKPL